MRWGRRWPMREPRPKVRRLTEPEQTGIMRSLEKGIAASPVLSAFGIAVRVARGRFYIERQRQGEDSELCTEVWGRITPLTGANKELLLECPYRKGTWSEVARGQAAKLINAVASDTRGGRGVDAMIVVPVDLLAGESQEYELARRKDRVSAYRSN